MAPFRLEAEAADLLAHIKVAGPRSYGNPLGLELLEGVRKQCPEVAPRKRYAPGEHDGHVYVAVLEIVEDGSRNDLAIFHETHGRERRAEVDAYTLEPRRD
jgi:hypothetical protein